MKCKKALNESNVGVQFKHVSKANICQSCGNPWSAGNYSFEVKKTFKTNKIRKILKKKAKREKVLNKALSAIEEHMVDRYNARKCSLIVKCEMCHQSTDFSMPLPRPSEKVFMARSVDMQKKATPMQNVHQKNLKTDKGKAVAAQTPKGKLNNKQKNITTKSLSQVTKPQGKLQQIKKGQLKNLGAALNDSKKKQSALQSFLSSIK